MKVTDILFLLPFPQSGAAEASDSSPPTPYISSYTEAIPLA